jgi:hypothetical protein
VWPIHDRLVGLLGNGVDVRWQIGQLPPTVGDQSLLGVKWLAHLGASAREQGRHMLFAASRRQESRLGRVKGSLLKRTRFVLKWKRNVLRARLPVERIDGDADLARVRVHVVALKAMADVVEERWLVEVVESSHVLHTILRQHVHKQQLLRACDQSALLMRCESDLERRVLFCHAHPLLPCVASSSQAPPGGQCHRHPVRGLWP